MYYRSKLLDLSTLARLEQLAPQPTDTPPNEAKLILWQLLERSVEANQALGMDERPYYQVLLADLKPDLPEALTPKRVGMLCRAMGLTLRRRNKGYLVAWNDAQLKILREYFRI